MKYELYRIVEPIVMRLKYNDLKDILKRHLDELNIDFSKECEKENPSIILEVYNDSEINDYLFKWLEMVTEIPGINKTYDYELDIMPLMVNEVAYITYVENDKTIIVALLPMDIKYNMGKGTTLYLFKLERFC